MPETVGSVTIHGMRNTFELPADLLHDPDVRSRLTSTFDAALGDVLADILQPMRHADDTLLFIRDLKIQCDLDLLYTSRDLTGVWSQLFARKLIAIVCGRDRDCECVHFENRADYLAHFLCDRVAGVASSAWYYREFEGLAHMPTDIAVRTALLDDEALGLAALHGMTDDRRLKVIGELSEAVAWRILDAFTGIASDTAVPEMPVFDAVSDIAEGGETFTGRPGAQALAWFVDASARRPDALGALGIWAAVVSLLRDNAGAGSSPDGRNLGLDIIRGHAARLFRSLPSGSAERLLPLIGKSREERERVVQVAHRSRHDTDTPQTRYTQFGGAFLFLAGLSRLPVDDAVHDWPDQYHDSAAAVMRLLALSACYGTARAQECFNDPLIRDLAGVGPQLSATQAREWLRSVPVRLIDGFVRTLARFRLREDSMTFRVATRGKRHFGIAVNARDGTWLLARGIPRTQSDHFFSHCLRVIGTAPDDIDQRANDNPDIDFLSLPAALNPGPRRASALLAVSQGLWSDVSRRLGSMSESSIPWLADNILPNSASVSTIDEQLVVRLSRPPLGVLLNMTGLNKQTVVLPWLDDRCLHIAGES